MSTDTINYGDSQITDPRDGSATWPWTVTMVEDVGGNTLGMQITGMPYTAPVVGEEFYAYLIF